LTVEEILMNINDAETPLGRHISSTVASVDWGEVESVIDEFDDEELLSFGILRVINF
jgi:hypothetical protein